MSQEVNDEGGTRGCLDTVSVTTEITKNGCQIFALAAAGLWAGAMFYLTQCPHREATFDGTTNIEWQAGHSPDTCFADWYVTVQNVSARSVPVRHVKVRVWGFTAPKAAGRNPAFVNMDALRPRKDSDYLFRKDFTGPDDPFIQRYSPAATANHTFEWVFDKRQSPEWVVFEIRLFEDVKGQEPVRHAFEWSAPCSVAEGS